MRPHEEPVDISRINLLVPPLRLIDITVVISYRKYQCDIRPHIRIASQAHIITPGYIRTVHVPVRVPEKIYSRICGCLVAQSEIIFLVEVIEAQVIPGIRDIAIDAKQVGIVILIQPVPVAPVLIACAYERSTCMCTRAQKRAAVA